MKPQRKAIMNSLPRIASNPPSGAESASAPGARHAATGVAASGPQSPTRGHGIDEASALLKHLFRGFDGSLAILLSLHDRLVALFGALRLRNPGVGRAASSRPPATRSGWAVKAHSKPENRAAISFHYDVFNEFYRLWLDEQRYGPVLFIVALALGGVLRSAIGNVSGAVVTGGAVGVIAWFMAGALSIAFFSAAAALLFTLVGGGGASGR